MDFESLKSILPVLVLGITGIIALVKVKARSDGTYQDMIGARKDLDRLEKEAADWSRTTVQLSARLDQAEKNITSLWSANASVLAKHDTARDRLDERFIALRDRLNGDKK